MTRLQLTSPPVNADEITRRHAIFLDLALSVAARHDLLPPALQDALSPPVTEDDPGGPKQQRVFEQ